MSAPTTKTPTEPVVANAPVKPRTTNQPRNVTASVAEAVVPVRGWQRFALPAAAALAVVIGVIVAWRVIAAGGATAAAEAATSGDHTAATGKTAHAARVSAAEAMARAQTALAEGRLEDAAALLTQATSEALPDDQPQLKQLRAELHELSAGRQRAESAAAYAADATVAVVPEAAKLPEHVATVAIPNLKTAPAEDVYSAAEAAFAAAEFPAARRAYVAYLRRAGGGPVAASHMSTAHARIALAMAAERRDTLGGWKVPEPALTFVDGLK